MFAEFRFAARALARWRGGALAAVLTLGIGIGATTSLYALARATLTDFSGLRAIERLGRIYSADGAGRERVPVSLGEYDATLSRARSFAAIGAYTGHVLPQVGKTIMDGKHAYRYLMNNKMTPVNQAVLNALMMSAGTQANQP